MPPAHLSPSATPPARRNPTFSGREEIASECAGGTGIRTIARKLSRSPSAISREISCNPATRGGDFDDRALTAQWYADRAARRPKPSKLVCHCALNDYGQDRLPGLVATPDGIAFDGPVVVWKGRRAVHRQSRRWSSAWSPEQIAQRLKADFPEDTAMRISHEAIYQAPHIQDIQGRGALKRELSACLRSGRALGLPRERARSRARPFLADALMISDRPAEVGDSEGYGTGYVPKNEPALAGHGAEAVRDAIAQTIMELPAEFRRSLTRNQGAEMARHAQRQIETGLDIYFCDPQSPLSADCFAIACRAVRGNAQALKIPMACYASTSQRAQILAGMARTSCAPSRMP